MDFLILHAWLMYLFKGSVPPNARVATTPEAQLPPLAGPSVLPHTVLDLPQLALGLLQTGWGFPLRSASIPAAGASDVTRRARGGTADPGHDALSLRQVQGANDDPPNH